MSQTETSIKIGATQDKTYTIILSEIYRMIRL
jgi:hypothetical protein